jgi:hypothetical protein
LRHGRELDIESFEIEESEIEKAGVKA